MSESVVADVAQEVKRSSGSLIFIGILMVIFGFLAMGAPLVTGIAVAILVGILMVAAGIMRIMFAFKAQSWGRGILGFILGALIGLCGLVMIFRPVFGLTSLTLVLAFYFLIDGIFQVVYAFQLKPIEGWGWTLFSGIVTVLLGFMIWRQWPVSGVWAIGLLVGINILFNGASVIGLGAAGKSAAKEIQAAA